MEERDGESGRGQRERKKKEENRFSHFPKWEKGELFALHWINNTGAASSGKEEESV